MHWWRLIGGAAAIATFVSATAAAQETVSFSSATHREAWRGETTGSQASISMDRGELSAGDSRRDLIVGAPGWNGGRGRVYVIFSGPIRSGEQSLSIADVTISGTNAGDRLGEATAAGYITAREQSTPLPTRDLVVGAPGTNGNSGAVYMYLRGLTNNLDYTTADATLTVTGAPANARLGASLATGDLDGDGYREIIIGAPGVGAVYVVRGGPTLSGTVNLSVPSAAFFTIQGSAADGVGSVVAAGDLLGHAIAGNNTIYDLAIGAPLEGGGTGAVYVIFGRPSNTFPATMNLAIDASARFGGIDAGDRAGSALQIAYLDRDRYADLVAAAPRSSGPGNTRALGGEIYVMWGSPALASRSFATADVAIYGAVAGYQEGSALAFGDINRDSWSDIVSLAPGAGTGGELHLFNAKARASWPGAIDLLYVFPDRKLIGDASHGVLKSTVVVDMTGEGFDDIAGGYPDDNQGVLQISHSLGGVITEAPLPHTVNPDVQTTFSAAADGSPVPTPQWQVSVDGVTWVNIPGATSTTYVFIARASDNGKRYRAVFTSSVNSVATSAAVLGVNAVARPARRADFDGDGATDVVVWRPSTGTWYSLTSSSAFAAGVAKTWGDASLGDKPFSADMDGDGMVDLVVWRPSDGTWYWLTSTTGYNYANASARQWGNASLGDVPMMGDMDGDGKADLVIWRESNGTFYWLTSSTNYSYPSARAVQWGNSSLGDQPILGDFDGDGKQDLAVWRASNGFWYWIGSSANYSYASAAGVQWGNSGLADKPLTGDVDGDGRTDLIVWRPGNGTWYWLKSSTGYTYATQGQAVWGNSSLGDIPTIGDFDGDGRADLAVWRTSNGTWYWLTSSSGYSAAAANGKQWGLATDIPVIK